MREMGSTPIPGNRSKGGGGGHCIRGRPKAMNRGREPVSGEENCSWLGHRVSDQMAVFVSVRYVMVGES